MISYPKCVPLFQCDIIKLCSVSQALKSQAMEKPELSVSPVDKVMAEINDKDLGQILIKRNNCWYKWCFQCIDIAGAEELSVEEHWSMYLTFAFSFIFWETSHKGLSLLSSASCSPARWPEGLQGCSLIWSSCHVFKDWRNQRSH